MIKNRNKKKESYSGWILFLFISVGLTLPFHWSLDYGVVFPKEHLTFSNTFFTNEDVAIIIERYNDANFLEKQTISQEPFFRKLIENISPQINRAVKNKSYFYNCYGKKKEYHIKNQDRNSSVLVAG